MKILPLIIFIILAFSVRAQCDYSVAILEENSSFKILARKLNGTATNISALAKITDLQENVVKEYSIWEQSPISRQKTSSPYIISLQPGKYTINAYIETDCRDSSEKNNMAAKPIEVTGSKLLGEGAPDDYDNTIYQKKEGQKIYKSSSEKTKDIGIIIFLAASVILNIILIWKR